MNLKTNIESALDKLQHWSSDHLMTVNLDKTSSQLFTMQKKPPNIKVKYQNSYLKQLSESKYLGIIFDSKLSWKNHITHIKEKTTKRLNILKRLAGVKWGCSPDKHLLQHIICISNLSCFTVVKF